MATARDIEILARTIYGEARGETDLGKLAVGWVVKNRAKLYKLGLGQACLRSIHFSAWNNGADNDSNQLAMMLVDLSDKDYARCMRAALAAVFELLSDPTNGATHYHANTVLPSWAEGKPYLSIGRHRFVKDVD